MTYIALNKDGEYEAMHRDEDGKMKVTVGPRFTDARRERLEEALSDNDFFEAYTIARDSLRQSWMPPVEVGNAHNTFEHIRTTDDYTATTKIDDVRRDMRIIESGKDHIRDIFTNNREHEQKSIQDTHFERVANRAPPLEIREIERLEIEANVVAKTLLPDFQHHLKGVPNSTNYARYWVGSKMPEQSVEAIDAIAKSLTRQNREHELAMRKMPEVKERELGD